MILSWRGITLQIGRRNQLPEKQSENTVNAPAKRTNYNTLPLSDRELLAKIDIIQSLDMCKTCTELAEIVRVVIVTRPLSENRLGFRHDDDKK